MHDGSTVRSLAVDIPAGQTGEQRALARRSLELRAELAALAPALNAEVRRAYWVVPAGGAAGVDGQLVGDALAPCRSEQEAQLRAVFGGPVGGAGTELRRSAEATFSEPAEAVEQVLRPLTAGGPVAGSLTAGSLAARPLTAGSRADGPRRDLVEGFAVRAVEPCAEGYRLIAEDGGELTARRVLAAPGAAALAGPFAATAKRLGARTKKVVAYRLRGGEPGGHRPLLVLDEPDAFLLPVGEGRDWYYSITSTDWDCPPERTRLAPNPDDRALAEAGGNLINGDRMWHYTEGIENWNPIWARHGIRILPGPSSVWLDATGNRLPVPLFPGFDTLGTLEHIMRTGHEHTWFVLNQRIIGKEFT
ncbi:FAD-binding protein, partial [Streptomyces sp. NPDC057757]|uniref:FAD-binding protein n=1 Tax=Streptomyces sp. NPDC057757 TaxID=3346241 RepID=UPI0036A0A5F5